MADDFAEPDTISHISISSASTDSTADSIDPIYQYTTLKGKTKTRTFANPKLGKAINDDKESYRKPSARRLIVLCACAFALLVVCFAVGFGIRYKAKWETGHQFEENPQLVSDHEQEHLDELMATHDTTIGTITAPGRLQPVTSSKINPDGKTTVDIFRENTPDSYVINSATVSSKETNLEPTTITRNEAASADREVLTAPTQNRGRSSTPAKTSSQYSPSPQAYNANDNTQRLQQTSAVETDPKPTVDLWVHGNAYTTPVTSDYSGHSSSKTVTDLLNDSQQGAASSPRETKYRPKTSTASWTTLMLGRPTKQSIEEAGRHDESPMASTIAESDKSKVDPLNAQATYPMTTSSCDGFLCGGNDGLCLPMTLYCDGIPNCLDSSDEFYCSTAVIPQFCAFENPLICNYIQDNTDDFDWSRRSGRTPSSSTGPSYDHTHGDSSGYYMYIEASGGYTNDVARLISPLYYASGPVCLRFWYHMYGSTIAHLNVYEKRSSESYLGTPLWSESYNKGNIWNYGNVTIPANSISSEFQVVFEGIRGSSYTGDIAVDDVQLQHGDCDDILSLSDIQQFRSNITVSFADPVELVCRLNGTVNPQYDQLSWRMVSKDNITTIVSHGNDLLIHGDDPEQPGQQNRYTLTWIPSKEYYKMTIHSVRNVDVGQWVCVFGHIDREESVWLEIKDPVCNWTCLHGGVCRHHWSGSAMCDCPWPYTGNDCHIGASGLLDSVCDFEDSEICGLTEELDGDNLDWIWSNHVADHTFGNSSGHFMYVASYVPISGRARLFTPVYMVSSFTQYLCVEFWYEIMTISNCNVSVLLRQSGFASDTIIYNFASLGESPNWNQQVISLPPSSLYFQVIFDAYLFDFNNSFSIDDLIISNGNCRDIEECSIGDFYCEDGTTCMGVDFTCDGNINCFDESDEKGCGDCGGTFYVPAYGSRKLVEASYQYNADPLDCFWSIETDQNFTFRITISQFYASRYATLDIGIGLFPDDESRQQRLNQAHYYVGRYYVLEYILTANEIWLHSFNAFYSDHQNWHMTLHSIPVPTLPMPGQLCTFDEAFICGYKQDVYDSVDWIRTPSGIDFGLTRVTVYDRTGLNGYFMLLALNSYGAMSRLISPRQPSSNAESCLEFWYSLGSAYSAGYSSLDVFVQTGEGNDTLLVRRSQSHEVFWMYAQIAFSVDDPYNVIFEGRTNNYNEYVALDHVRISDHSCGIPHCGGNITLDEFKALQLTSPNYPDNYDDNDNCIWYITSNQPGEYVINFETFEVGPSHYLDVGTGRDPFAIQSRLIRGSGVQMPNDVRLLSTEIWINWMTTMGANYTGWNLTVNHVPLCLHNITLEKNEKLEISSENYPSDYDNLIHCIWLVSTEEGYAIGVRFLDFRTEWKHDNVSIGFGHVPSNTSRVMYHSGFAVPEDWDSTSNEIWIDFATDHAITYPGFKLEVTSTKYCENIGIPMCESYLPYGGYLFYSPLGLTRQQAETEMGKTRQMEGCHEHVDLFMCSVLSPECGIDGFYRQPCLEFCEEVRQSCGQIYAENGYEWPVNCTTLEPKSESRSCVRVTPCLGEPCKNNATCHPLDDDNYECNCTLGYVGKDCEINFDECSSGPCQNGGTCIDGIGGFICRCPIGFDGVLCNCIDLNVEICHDVRLNYARLQLFQSPGGHTRSQAVTSFLESESRTRASEGCYEHIGYFMCTLFAPDCTDAGYYRPPCEGFCSAARKECEPRFAAGGIDWVIDCELLPDSNDSSVCTLDPDVSAGHGICGTRMYGSNRIVNGYDAELGAWPWQISLLLYNDHNCGGTVIYPNWILTAAHCVEAHSTYQLTIKVGFVSHQQGSAYLQTRPVAQIYVHPSYQDYLYGWDAALLYIDTPLEYNDYIRPACLPPADDNYFFADGDECTISGWGRLSEYGSKPDHLQEAEVLLTNQQDCSSAHGRHIADSNICAGLENREQGVCYGDSGGPLICRKANGRWYLAGVASYKRGNCGTSYYPDVFTRVTSVVEWIEETISQASIQQAEMSGKKFSEDE